MIVVRVVGTARQMAGQAVFQRLLGGQQRAAHGPHGAPCQRLAPGQAQPAVVFAGQFAGHVAFDIGRVMGQGEDIHRAQLGAQQPGILGQPGLDQVVTQQTELVHRKSVIRREHWAVVIVVNQRYRHRDFRVVTSAGY